MDEKYLVIIKELSDKLGTTAEHLWSVLIRQAPINAMVDFAFFLAFVVEFYFWVRFVLRKTKDGEWYDEAPVFVAWLSVAIGGLLVMLFGFLSIQNMITAFVNPEYWALMKLLGR